MSAQTHTDWSTHSTADGTVEVGDYVSFTKPISDDDVQQFAEISGDTNPLHLDAEHAAETMFDGRIVHGMAVASTISAALARLPGTVIYLSQDLEFHNPVRIGERVTASVEVAEALGDDQYRVTTHAEDADGETVIVGEATVLIREVSG